MGRGGHVSEDALRVLVSREDQELLTRRWPMPFDVGDFRKRAWVWLQGHYDADPSGSTIPQQVAKNLFTDGRRSGTRKLVEADYAAWLSATQTPREILQVYVNLVEFGPGIYGVCAASWNYFDKPPSELTVQNTATLVGLMPNPKKWPIYDRRVPGRTAPTILFARAHASERLRNIAALPRKAQEELFIVNPKAGGPNCSRPPQSLKDRQMLTQPGGYGRFTGDQAY